MTDLDPASALANRILTHSVRELPDNGIFLDCDKTAVFIEKDRAAVREPLERQVRELEEQAEDDRRDYADAAALDFPGGRPTREDLIEGLQGLVESHDAHVERIADLEVRAEKLGALADSGAAAMFSAADQRIGELEATVRQFVVAEKRFNDRIAALEAQLASARPEALREAIRAVEAINEAHWCTPAGIKTRAIMVLQSRISFVRDESPPKSPWIPLTERRPEHGDGVLLLGVYASGEDFFYHPCSWPPVELYDAADDVTHWMPIPPRPAAQKEPL